MKALTKIATLCIAGLVSFSSVAAGHDEKVTADINDPVTLRINMMKNVGAATGLLGAMVKEEAAFDARVALAAFMTINNAALGMHTHFPEGVESTYESVAAPAIWQNPEGFSASVAKFVADTTSAVEAKPADLDALKLVFASVSGSCRDCHQEFRLRH